MMMNPAYRVKPNDGYGEGAAKDASEDADKMQLKM